SGWEARHHRHRGYRSVGADSDAGPERSRPCRPVGLHRKRARKAVYPERIAEEGAAGSGGADATLLPALRRPQAIKGKTLAGAPGFEPGNAGIKIRCLTTWLRPKRVIGSDPGRTLSRTTIGPVKSIYGGPGPGSAAMSR